MVQMFGSHGGPDPDESDDYSQDEYDRFDDSGFPVANPDWRNDPARLAAWRDRIEQTQQVYAEAHEYLRKAQEAFARVGVVDADHEALVARGKRAVGMALVQFDRDSDLVQAAPTDTYLGNKAAFSLPPGVSVS